MGTLHWYTCDIFALYCTTENCENSSKEHFVYLAQYNNVCIGIPWQREPMFYLYYRNERIQIKICYFADAKKRPGTVAPRTDEMHPEKLSQSKHLINKFLENSGIRGNNNSTTRFCEGHKLHKLIARESTNQTIALIKFNLCMGLAQQMLSVAGKKRNARWMGLSSAILFEQETARQGERIYSTYQKSHQRELNIHIYLCNNFHSAPVLVHSQSDKSSGNRIRISSRR